MGKKKKSEELRHRSENEERTSGEEKILKRKDPACKVHIHTPQNSLEKRDKRPKRFYLNLMRLCPGAEPHPELIIWVPDLKRKKYIHSKVLVE